MALFCLWIEETLWPRSRFSDESYGCALFVSYGWTKSKLNYQPRVCYPGSHGIGCDLLPHKVIYTDADDGMSR